MPESGPWVIGVSGSSGIPVAVRVLAALRAAGEPSALVVSAGAEAVLKEECGLRLEDLARQADSFYPDRDLASPLASGSRRTRGMAIVPCSGNTAAKVALGLSDTLLTRAAQVHLKERRKLVLLVRETPLSTVLLGHLGRLSELGCTVLTATVPYYLHPERVSEVTDFLAGRLLDQLGVEHALYQGWRQGAT
ncbi:MAG: UbiX family flavin prenyltransferase [Thermoplasmata archaeon]|nr:UbiX family flavin prenyltransferase [Thermoplasmata archaeon]